MFSFGFLYNFTSVMGGAYTWKEGKCYQVSAARMSRVADFLASDYHAIEKFLNVTYSSAEALHQSSVMSASASYTVCPSDNNMFLTKAASGAGDSVAATDGGKSKEA